MVASFPRFQKRGKTQLRVQLHLAARSTASAANVARPWRKMFQRLGNGWWMVGTNATGILSPWIARYFADCWIFHVIFVQDFMKQKVGVQVMPLVEKNARVPEPKVCHIRSSWGARSAVCDTILAGWNSQLKNWTVRMDSKWETWHFPQINLTTTPCQ